MLCASEFDALREFVKELHALRRECRQKTMTALLQFTIGIKVGD